jgi:hypothetical protein
VMWLRTHSSLNGDKKTRVFCSALEKSTPNLFTACYLCIGKPPLFVQLFFWLRIRSTAK